jgi:hypothetical protein
LGLLDRGGERGFFKHWLEANRRFDSGEYQKARAHYERLLEEAFRLFGPDDANTLHVRASLANTYAEEAPERACELLEEVVRDCARVFGPGGEIGLRPRFDLAGVYGQMGDYAACHKLSVALLADCERVLGPLEELTAKVREVVAHSAGDLAHSQLGHLLDLSAESLEEQPPPADWEERLGRCAANVEGATTYRARLATRFSSLGESGCVEHLLDYVRPDRFHVRQYMWDSVDCGEIEDADYDEWITVSGDYYDIGIGPALRTLGLAEDAEFVEGRRAQNQLLRMSRSPWNFAAAVPV